MSYFCNAFPSWKYLFQFKTLGGLEEMTRFLFNIGDALEFNLQFSLKAGDQGQRGN